MKRVSFTLGLLCAISALDLQAQELVRSCGTMHNHDMLLQQDVQFAENINRIEQFTQQWIANHPQGTHDRSVITIPVVVHVVYNTATENISDAQIQSQLAVLNKDFSRTNTDAANTPSVWQSIAANTGIQFCLAVQDPTGLRTTGITRTATSVTAFTENNYVKYTANGGKDAWNRDKYLNIWVCDLSAIIGYAQFPGGPAATDGVVVDYQAFGTMGTASVPFHLGRTATHEIGHWLNLKHIWGDDVSACTGSDQVGDTPNHADENYGCPTFPTVSCNNAPNGDMFMNYMDYSNDICMNIFTLGQKARMQALFVSGGARYSLVTSIACSTEPAPPTVTCNVPTGLSVASIGTATAVLNWSAVSGATAYSMRFKATASPLWVTSNVTLNTFALAGLTQGTQYEFQVKTTCGTQSSAYSSSATFTTAATATGCVDLYEPNETRSAAKGFPTGLSLQAKIGAANDADWYRIGNTSSKRNIKITLTNLPANFNLALYSSNGTLLRQSTSTGTTSETIIYNNGSLGTYYVYVFGSSGTYNTSSCYTLTAQLGTAAFRTVKSTGARATEEEERDFIERIYPNPASQYLVVDVAGEAETAVQCNVYDLSGKLVLTQHTMAPGDNQIIINTTPLNTGVYFLHLHDGNQAYVRRFLIEK